MFRFSIRDVLRLTVVVALAVGWWIDRSELDRQRTGWYYAWIEAIEASGGHVSVDLKPATLNRP